MSDCGEYQGWPGHHPGCSKYGIPRTEAGAELLRMLEDSIYRGGGRLGGFARSDIVAIEDEAEVRATNREVAALLPRDDLALLRLGFMNGYLAAANDRKGINAGHLLRAMHEAEHHFDAGCEECRLRARGYKEADRAD